MMRERSGSPCALCGREHVPDEWWPRHPFKPQLRIGEQGVLSIVGAATPEEVREIRGVIDAWKLAPILAIKAPRVMVDELVAHPQARHACFRAGACHLTMDPGTEDLAPLHAMAARIGLKRAWFQPRSSPHYDLTESKRALALEAGAVFVSAREQARVRVAWRERHHPAHGNARDD